MVTPSDREHRVEGQVDRFEKGRLWGWCWRPTDPATAVLVEVVSGGGVIANAVAHHYRKDLEVAGKRMGSCAFEIRLPESFTGGDILVRADSGEGLVDGVIHVASAGPAGTHAPPVFERSDRIREIVPLKGGAIEGCLDVFGPTRIGGWARFSNLSRFEPVRFDLFADGALAGTIAADRWRVDLAETRQGDGRGAIDAALPPSVLDGRPHKFDLRLANNGASVFDRPIEIVTPNAPAPAATAEPKSSAPTGAPEISIVVVFYNMRREAERTLQSLSRSYQQGVEDLPYEVICVDNGSNPPLDADWVRSFGPEFSLFTPSRILSSPCAAINEAAAKARGRHVAIMIDGAHVLTPGVFREAMSAFRESADSIVAVRHWFVGGDQRWLGDSGYTREQEDILFSRIDWPNFGYDLFKVSTPITESPNCWFDGLIESNCLFMPRTLFARIGGMDEKFSEAGGEFSNLDLFRRAYDAVDHNIFCLIGEASFHQFHGGTTTNVSDIEKERRVRRYENRYREIRGEDFLGIEGHHFKLRGSIEDTYVFAIRQRPLFPASIGVTTKFRRPDLPIHFDEGAQEYLQGVYAEAGPTRHTIWQGRRVGLAPTDLVSIQEIIRRVRPGRIVTNSDDVGLIGFLDSVLPMLELEQSRIIHVSDAGSRTDDFKHVARIRMDLMAKGARTAIEDELDAEENVVVLYCAGERAGLPIEQLREAARYLSVGSYLVFLNTAGGQPYLGYSRQWKRKAVQILTAETPDLVIDRSWEAHFVTSCPWGYVRRLGGPRPYDAMLNDLEGTLIVFRFWICFISPIIELTAPRELMEIGAERGRNTENILNYCRASGARAHIVDPSPQPDLKSVLGGYGQEFVYLPLRSVDAIPLAPTPDVALIDGDHNWRTVFAELKLLFVTAAERGAKPPIVLHHDVGWPYGRRDMYYDPSAFKNAERHEYAYRGLVPGSEDLVDGGMDEHYANALQEGGPMNGVLTAIEDFVASWSAPLRFRTLPFWNGLGILAAEERMTPALSDLIESFFSAESLMTACMGYGATAYWNGDS